MEEFLTFKRFETLTLYRAIWHTPCTTNQPLTMYQISLRSDERILQRSRQFSSKFKVVWQKNYDRYQKSCPNKFRYFPLVQESAVICQLPLKMAEETDFDNGRISNLQHHVTLDRAIWHMVVHHSSTTYVPNFIRIGESFCGWMNEQMNVCTDYGFTHTYMWTDGRTDWGRLSSRPNKFSYHYERNSASATYFATVTKLLWLAVACTYYSAADWNLRWLMAARGSTSCSFWQALLEVMVL